MFSFFTCLLHHFRSEGGRLKQIGLIPGPGQVGFILILPSGASVSLSTLAASSASLNGFKFLPLHYQTWKVS